MAQQTQNKMKEIRLEKVVLNMGVGKSGDAIEIGKKALDQIIVVVLLAYSFLLQKYEKNHTNSVFTALISIC